MTDSPTIDISVAAAAALLDVTPQTVRNYIREGELSARREGARAYVIERTSVEDLLLKRPLLGRRGRRRADMPARAEPDAVLRERDDLRARVVELQETILRLRSAAALQDQANAERAKETRHLTEALQAAERAGDLDRRAANELMEALGGIAMPGHPGQVS